jgi:hypothetical protein
MKEKLLELINHIYFGIYSYTGEAFYATFQNGRRQYYQGFWGMKLCYIMVFLYACGFVSFIGYLIGCYVLKIVNSFLVYKLIHIFLIIYVSLIISKYTSLGREKGLSLFEQFTLTPKISKIKWMIIGAIFFFLGIVFFAIGIKIFPVW